MTKVTHGTVECYIESFPVSWATMKNLMRYRVKMTYSEVAYANDLFETSDWVRLAIWAGTMKIAPFNCTDLELVVLTKEDGEYKPLDVSQMFHIPEAIDRTPEEDLLLP